MLNQIKLFFDEHIKLPAPEETSAEQLQIASAALLLEMVTMDDKIEAIEQETVSAMNIRRTEPFKRWAVFIIQPIMLSVNINKLICLV